MKNILPANARVSILLSLLGFSLTTLIDVHQAVSQQGAGSLATDAERQAFTQKLEASLRQKVNPPGGWPKNTTTKYCNKNDVDSAFDARSLCGDWGVDHSDELALLRACILPMRQAPEPGTAASEYNYCASLASLYESRGDYVQASLAAEAPGCQSSPTFVGRSKCLQEEVKIYRKVGRSDLLASALQQLCSSFNHVGSCSSLNAMGASVDLNAVQAKAANCWWQWAKGPKWQDHKDHTATG